MHLCVTNSTLLAFSDTMDGCLPLIGVLTALAPIEQTDDLRKPINKGPIETHLSMPRLSTSLSVSSLEAWSLGGEN